MAWHGFLKQSTAVTINLGPFVAPATGLPVASVDVDHGDVLLSKNGAAFAAKNDATDNAASDANGFSSVALDATDTNTVGRLQVIANLSADTSNPMVVKQSYSVVPAAVYDLWFGGTGALLAPDGALAYGTAAAIAAGTITLASGHGIATVGSVIIELISGTDAKGKSRFATYSGSGDVFNVSPPWNEGGESTPSGTITYRVLAAPPSPKLTAPTAAITATPTADQALAFIATLARNKITDDGVNQTLYADDGSTVIATWPVSALGTTFTRAEGS